jgi:guanosine-3',5'-bis(diphosphate) 3'-pyrophosphohydrolase
MPSLIIAAANFSAIKHQYQRRKGIDQTPYINHPLAVANILANEADITDISTLCAAILHDTIEDTQTEIDELRALFGDEIAQIVQELTDDKSLEKSVRKQRQVEFAATKSFKAKCVKIADKTSNLRDLLACPPADWTEDRKIEYCLWALSVVDQIRGTHERLEMIFDQAFAKHKIGKSWR